MTIYEMGSSLEKLLSTLKKNCENVPLQVLKTQYKQPYEALIHQINKTATAFVKDIVTHQLLINPDADVQEQISVINQTIEESGMLKEMGRCISGTYSALQLQSMAIILRELIEDALAPYIAQKNCLVADLSDIEKQPIIYNTLTKMVYENGTWIERELNLQGKLLIYVKSEEIKEKEVQS